MGLLACPAPAASDTAVVRNDFGGIGLIETPTARMAPDGELSLGGSFFRNTQHYNLGFQIFPWLEGTFRYSGLQHFSQDFPVYYDRAFAIKARLWDDQGGIPALAIGINDLVGTGIYGSEYIVASKKIGNFDTSLGFGWGRSGTANTFRNPLGAISDSFYKRAAFNGLGGTFNLNQYFHGPATGVFGGVSWHTPIRGLTLLAEYSSDAYVAERAAGNFKPQNQFNFGASYQPVENVTLGLSYLYGETIAGSITFSLDPVHLQYRAAIAPPVPPVSLRSPEQQQVALNTLMRQSGSPRNEAERRASEQVTARQQLNNMVDTLFQKGLSDARIEGRDLVLTAPGTNSTDRCRQYAILAGIYETNVDTVVLAGGSAASRKTIRCPISATRRTIQYVTPSPIRVAASPEPVIIDATKGAPSTPADRATAARNIRRDVLAQKIAVEAINVSASEVTLYYANTTYLDETEAVKRIAHVLMADAPADVEKFRLVAMEQSTPGREFTLLRGPLERALAQNNPGNLLEEAVAQSATPMNNPILSLADRHNFPRFSWKIYPQFRQALFDPSNPFGVQFVAVLGAQVELFRGLTLGGSVEGNLYDNFDTARITNSVLPHVRSEFNQYFTHGKNGMNDLGAAYRFRINPNIFAVAKAGYLESMFAGAGGEILWRPDGQRWALGADAYQVWQRGFDRLLDLQRYKAFTGHVSLYYQSPWYDLNFAVRAGQYLAQDRGLTLEVTRRFSTGVVIGAFATKTNVSSAQFGEGSFDKGIIIRIPLGWALPIDTQSQFAMDIRPIQRDGGQRLIGDASLYEETERTSEGEILDHAERLSQ
jgi:hypothetical protein